MVYEIFGIPGSGKTTCCENLKKYSVKNPIIFYRNNNIGKILFHIFLRIYWIDKELCDYMKKIKNIIGKDKKYVNIYNSKITIDLYIKYMLFSYFIEKKSKGNIVIDEGIIHFCTAMYAEFDLEIEKIKKIINIFKDIANLEIIYLECSVNIAIEQSKKRQRKRAAIDFLNDIELKKLYQRYEYICTLLSRNYLTLTALEIEEKIKYDISIQ